MQFHLGLFLFLLGGAIAQLVCPDVPATGCNVCPPGECITNLDAIFVNPIDATVTVPCGDLQQGGLDGGIDPVTECPFLPGLITVCECMPKGSPTGAPDDPSTGLETLEPIDVIDPTDAPVGPPVLDVPLADPTPAPVVVPTDAPVIGPTDAPVNGPTDAPIIVPTDAPVIGPTDAPVNGPTDAPVVVPTDAPIAPTPMPTDVIVPDGAPSAEPTTDDSQEQEPSTAPNPNLQTVYPVFASPPPSGAPANDVPDPISTPAANPTPAPVVAPTPAPATDATSAPMSDSPVVAPTSAPTVTSSPTVTSASSGRRLSCMLSFVLLFW